MCVNTFSCVCVRACVRVGVGGVFVCVDARVHVCVCVCAGARARVCVLRVRVQGGVFLVREKREKTTRQQRKPPNNV